jgi:hypothetical protein
MLKKLLLILLLLITFNVLNSQHLPIFPSDKSIAKKNKQTFKDISENYEKYFASKDREKKGSGYKPFKRWEYHWSQYLLQDGTIAPAENLWNAWEEKQKMAKSSTAVSNWSALGPFAQSSNSGQGRINTIVVDPNNANTIYVGAPAGGIWKSTDAGVNWTPLTDHLPQIGVSGIAIDPNNSNIIYISTGDDDAGDSYSIGVLKSIDGGINWTQTGSLGSIIGDNSYPTSNEILIDPTDSNIVWVATGAGLFKSINAGVSWVNKLTGEIKDFKLKPGNPNTVYAVSRNTYFKSTSGGEVFAAVTAGLPDPSSIGRLRVEVTDAAPNNVYVLAAKSGSQNWAFEGIYKSTSSGASFIKTLENDDIFGSSQAWYDLAFAVSPTNSDEMYVGVLDIWKSSNEGDDFIKLNSWFLQTPSFTHADIHFMRFYNGVLYAGTDGGVYRSSDGGSTFTDLTENLAISQFYKVTVAKQNSNKLAGGLQDNGGFSFSNNIWHNYHGGDGMDSASDPNDENTFYGFTQFGGNLTVTNDGGLNSTSITNGPSQGNWVTPLVINKQSEIYAGFDQLYKLINNDWNQVSNHFFAGNIEVIEIDPSNNSNIFVSQGIKLYKSIDKGVTFSTYASTQTGLSGVNISSIEVHNTNSNIIWVTTTGLSNLAGPSSGHTGGGVFKSTDGGLTFTNISSGLPDESKFVIRHHPFTTNNSIYVGTALGVYHRNDDTNSWEVFSTNLPNVAVPDIEINPYDNTITAATYGRSVWQSTIPSITLPTLDIDLLKTNLSDNILTCGEVSPTLIVLNNGQNPISSFTINYSIDGGTNEVYNWTGLLTSNTTSTINLPTIVLTEGNHTINTDIILPNDSNEYNNTSQSTFNVTLNQSGEGQYINTFGDVNQDEWIVSDNNLWQIGAPTTTDLNGLVTSGYVTNPSGNYPDQTTSYLISPCYNLSSLENPILKFKMAFDLEPNWDIIFVEYSTDQGENWQILGTASDPNWYNSNRTNASSGPNNDCQNCPGAQWTGFDNVIKEYSYNLSAFNGESNIIFRFAFISDQSINEEGVVIDDFQIDASSILSVNDFEDGEFLIYPNPSSDIFNIRRVRGNNEEMNVKVYDIMGKLIRQDKNITDANYKLNMAGISKGIYFLQVNIENKFLVKKLVMN